MANGNLTYYESATRRLSKDAVENSDLPLREIVQLLCEWVSFCYLCPHLHLMHLMDNHRSSLAKAHQDWSVYIGVECE
jgi:hypothetical protein